MDYFGVGEFMYQPSFKYTHIIVKALAAIERAKVTVEMLPLPLELEKELRNSVKVRMAHYSTRIEGNLLDLDAASEVVLRKDRIGSKAEQEVRNYWDALTFIDTAKRMRIRISEGFIKRLHAIIEVRGAGRRTKQSEFRGPMPPGVLFAVYDNLTGVPDYIPPDNNDVPKLMRDFLGWLNSDESRELPVPIKAAIAVYQLLTIHPFDDGNGRTARALATYILSEEGYNLKGFNSMEEYYANDLHGYYSNLQMGLPVLYYEGRNNPPDLAPWIEYFVSIMEHAFSKVATLAQKAYKQREDSRLKNLEPREKVVIKMLLTHSGRIAPKDLADEFKVNPRTISKWAHKWLEKGIIEPASGEKRITLYKIGENYSDLQLDDLGFL